MSLPPYRWKVDAAPMSTVSTTLTGRVETICTPRLSIHVTGAFHLENSASKRAAIVNFWQWASRGLSFAMALDPAKTVATTLTAHALAVDYQIQVQSAAGITVGGVYRLFDGPNYQLVTVTGITGTTLTLSDTLNLQFSGVDATYPSAYRIYAAQLRDQNYFIGSLRDKGLPLPIVDSEANQDQGQTLPQSRFRLSLDFYENLHV
jgi:hypothetical protein